MQPAHGAEALRRTPRIGRHVSHTVLEGTGHRMGARTVLKDSDHQRRLAWKAASTLSAVLGGIATRKLLEVGWATLKSSDPPGNPADRRISWGQAVQWAVATGVGVGIGRLVSERLAASGWELATGTQPPGLDTD